MYTPHPSPSTRPSRLESDLSRGGPRIAYVRFRTPSMDAKCNTANTTAVYFREAQIKLYLE